MSGAFAGLDKLAANLTPFVLSALLVMFSAMPIELPIHAAAAPNLALVAVFYWTIYRPDLLPAPAVLVLGVWQDLLTGSLIGMNAIVLLFVHGAIIFQRAFFQDKSFAVIWWAFGLTAAVAALIIWLAAMSHHLAVIDPAPAVFQFAITLAVYPFLTWLFAKIHHANLRQA